MIFREATVTDLNSMANHPKVRPLMVADGEGPMEMKGTLRPGYADIGFISGIGGMVFQETEPGKNEFCAHFLFIPGSGGSKILGTARAMIDEMFTVKGACAIKGFTPRENRAARVIDNALGFRKLPDEFTDELGDPYVVYELRRNEWVGL